MSDTRAAPTPTKNFRRAFGSNRVAGPARDVVGGPLPPSGSGSVAACGRNHCILRCCTRSGSGVWSVVGAIVRICEAATVRWPPPAGAKTSWRMREKTITHKCPLACVSPRLFARTTITTVTTNICAIAMVAAVDSGSGLRRVRVRHLSMGSWRFNGASWRGMRFRLCPGLACR